MIKFRQKQYAVPLLGLLGSSAVGTGVMIGSTALGMKQSADAAKQNEEIAEQQQRDAAKTRAALDRLANSNASPEVKSQAANLFSDQRLYAASGGFIKNSTGFVKDLWNHSGGGVKNAVKTGAGFAAMGYVGNRIATSLKNKDEGRSDKNKNFLKKAAIGAATVGGGILAARKGMLGKGVQNYMTTGTGSKVLNNSKDFLLENASPVGKKGINWMNTAFLAMPTVSYLAQKKSKQNMVDDTRQYSFVGSIANTFKSGIKGLKTNPKRTITGGINKVGNFFGFMGGTGGTTAVQSGFKRLEEIGKKSGNKYTQSLAKWGQKNPNAANLVTAGAAVGVGSTAMGIGGKLFDKPMKAFDKDAYKIDEMENGKI